MQPFVLSFVTVGGYPLGTLLMRSYNLVKIKTIEKDSEIKKKASHSVCKNRKKCWNT